MQTEVKVKSGFENTSIKLSWSQICAHLWLAYFLLSIIIIGLIFAYGLCAPLYIVGRFYEPAMRRAERYLCRYIAFLMWVQPWLKGSLEIKLPVREEKKGLLIVSNHRSTLESFILLSRVAGIRMFTKTSLIKIPLLGCMMILSRQIPAHKGRLSSFLKAMETIRLRLREGEIVQIFPELTRCTPGFAGVQRFTSFPFLVAIQENIDILPVIFHNTDTIWPKGSFTLFSGHTVKISTLDPIKAGQFTCAEQLKDQVRKQIENELLKEAR